MENQSLIQELKNIISHLKEEGAKKDAFAEQLLEQIKELKEQIDRLTSQLNRDQSSEVSSEEENTIVEDASGEPDGSSVLSTKSSSSTNSARSTKRRSSTPKADPEVDGDAPDFEIPSTRKYRRRKRGSKSSDDEGTPQTPKKRAPNNNNVQTTTGPSIQHIKSSTSAPTLPTGQSTSSQEARIQLVGVAPVAATVPPIVLRDKTRYNALVTIFNSKKFRFTRAVTLQEGVRIHPETPQDFRNITKFLEENGESFHTFQFQEDKLNHVVLRGVVETLTVDEITEDLRGKGHNPHKVIRWHYRSGDPMPMVLVLVPKNDKAIFALTEVRHNKIRVEPQHSKSKSTQCFNCQLFGHSSHLCRAPPKCVKCGQGHLTSVCQKTREAPPKCANCEGEHTASYRGCPAHPSQKAATAPANTQATFSWANRRQAAAAPPVTPLQTYMTEALSSINSMNSAMQALFKNIQNFQKLSATFMPLLNSNTQV